MWVRLFLSRRQRRRRVLGTEMGPCPILLLHKPTKKTIILGGSVALLLHTLYCPAEDVRNKCRIGFVSFTCQEISVIIFLGTVTWLSKVHPVCYPWRCVWLFPRSDLAFLLPELTMLAEFYGSQHVLGRLYFSVSNDFMLRYGVIPSFTFSKGSSF